MNIISKYGELTKIAKIRIFLIYMKSKINHLIPLIAITGGIKELWKTIRKIIFNTLLEHSTLPRESASAFGLGYYEIIVRPILKLRERNRIYTNNIEEDEMIGEALINILKYWLVAEPKHTDFVKEIITANIEGKRTDNYNYFDKIITKECGDRLFRGHNLNEDQSSKLRRIKCPGLIVLISNEPAHEIKERILKINKACIIFILVTLYPILRLTHHTHIYQISYPITYKFQRLIKLSERVPQQNSKELRLYRRLFQ